MSTWHIGVIFSLLRISAGVNGCNLGTGGVPYLPEFV